MWTDPQHVAAWWGPNGFTNTILEMDVRPGGIWRFVMHGPNGVDYDNRIAYTEVVRPERLVYFHGSDVENDPGRFHVTVTFAEERRKTRLTMRSLFVSAAERDKVVKEFGALEGANQHLDRLEQHLKAVAAAVAVEARDNDLILTRIFDAPRALVFKAWTDPRHLARWWGPHTFTSPVYQLDLRPGGAYRITLRSPESVDYPIRGEFVEIVASERLVMTMDTTDHPAEWHQAFNQLRGQAQDARIMKLVMTVLFADHDGRTKLTVRQRFESTADRDANLKMGAPTGWSQSFERLDALLARKGEIAA
jgi:uncharacterized protein YndB with AHSA1/START domain